MGFLGKFGKKKKKQWNIEDVPNDQFAWAVEVTAGRIEDVSKGPNPIRPEGVDSQYTGTVVHANGKRQQYYNGLPVPDGQAREYGHVWVDDRTGLRMVTDDQGATRPDPSSDGLSYDPASQWDCRNCPRINSLKSKRCKCGAKR